MSEKVRVSDKIRDMARAMCAAEGHDPDYLETDYHTDGRMAGIMFPQRHLRWVRYVVMAEAALKALREPTEAMAIAGSNLDMGLSVHDVVFGWQAMIDEALK